MPRVAAGQREGRVAYHSLELTQALSPDTLPIARTLTLNYNRISETKNGAFSALSLLKRLDGHDPLCPGCHGD